MKYFLVLLALAAMVVAGDDGQGSSVASPAQPTEGTDAITVSLVNDWVLAEKALGLDIVKEGSLYALLGVDNILDIVQAYDPATGTPWGSLTLDPSNGSCFGIAWNDDTVDDAYYTNDWGVGSLFYTDDFGSTWSTSANPAGILGRGMAFDGADYWQTDRDGGSVWRFRPGVGEESISVPEVSGTLSGVAVYPEGGNLGVIVAGYNDPSLHFYEWDGSTMTYLGNASYPVSGLASSFGLAYYEVDGSLYWSYLDTVGDYHLTKLEFDTTALQQETWGAIKSTF
mgnify:CR=1 FL=1